MIGKFLRGTIIALCVVSAVRADQITLSDGHATRYTVVRGDTLWDIAGHFLRYPWQWPSIWKANQQIQNPNLIYPGDELVLSYVDGRPLLSLTRGRSLKLSPTVREYGRGRAVPPIPLDAIQQFLSRPRVVSEAEIDQAAYVIGNPDQRLVTGLGDKIYVRGIANDANNRFSVFRPGGEYRDPDTHASLGFEALHIADVVVNQFGDPATAVVVWSNREIIKGDRLMPQEHEEFPEFVPRPPDHPTNGRIIAVIDGVSQIGHHNVVVVNKGIADGLEPGTVLAIFQTGALVEDEIGTAQVYRKDLKDARVAEAANPSAVGRFFDGVGNGIRSADLAASHALGERIGGAPMKVQLPDERAGELMLFRSFDHISYGLVMRTHKAVHVLDYVRNP